MLKYLTYVAAIITILVFVTGIFSLPQFLGLREEARPQLGIEHSPSQAQNDLPRGIVTLQEDEGFSFALGEKTSAQYGDIGLSQHYDYRIGDSAVVIRLGPYNTIKPLGPVDLDSITECPKASVWWQDKGDVKVKVGTTYAIALSPGVFSRNKQYALIRVLDADNAKPGSIRFEYVYQPNGSRYFGYPNND